MSIKENYYEVLSKIKVSAEKSCRKAEDINLVAISKTADKDSILEVYNLGQRKFGENYLQPALEKIDNLPNDIEWHYTGRLQRRKCKEIVSKFSLIHSVDAMKHIIEIDKRVRVHDKIMDILLQINFHHEASKGGILDRDSLFNIIDESLELNNINLRGIMIMPPFQENPEKNRKYFIQARETLGLVRKKYGIEEFNILSMGMTEDFEIAIEEGATHVRVGTGIFKD